MHHQSPQRQPAFPGICLGTHGRLNPHHRNRPSHCDNGLDQVALLSLYLGRGPLGTACDERATQSTAGALFTVWLPAPRPTLPDSGQDLPYRWFLLAKLVVVGMSRLATNSRAQVGGDALLDRDMFPEGADRPLVTDRCRYENLLSISSIPTSDPSASGRTGTDSNMQASVRRIRMRASHLPVPGACARVNQ
ncbi:hypothetical protein LX32DRAFT_305530 [Colletotrichum zoysiae]|uniref:Uncharacterized protein n=1 Tax=Colletotrichum zoysiae TaxID=1216348 RepID=A0AAD9HUT5_9PEZI|nr:hypothetical protein LX32DRAFT_305530 [Colletotrichum zoysiae]